ncbi:metallophosphoesterase [Allorhizobium terrae]|uniref:Phosphatase n=1 Tax=Allorhizobium terrae TaxID=1848972 RepID=A0A4S3ZPU5_9HYPH|nr:metallophosphoesterase [Allorhizobium terrae]THF47551.1 phosphatase [Allorhizobium terrae]
MQKTSPLLRLGIIADPQYAALPPDARMDRHYANSLTKLRAAIHAFNLEDLDRVVVLGDLIDRGFEHFAPALETFAASRHPVIFLPGNHDFAVKPEQRSMVQAALDMPAPYYDVVVNGVRLIITDCCEISTFAPPPGDARLKEAESLLAALKEKGAINAHDWNAGMSASQIAWLKSRLALAEQHGEKAIVLGHYPLHPFSDHALWDAQTVAEIISSSPAALAYLSGHDHRGNYGKLGHTHFINFKGMVDTERDNAYATLKLMPDTLIIEGSGRQESYTLAI